VQAATVTAAEVPLATARDALRVMELADEVARKGNVNAVTDAATAGWLALAAMQGLRSTCGSTRRRWRTPRKKPRGWRR
jgi:formiminotetrahydrofolate cyclodeaminase